jgi:hypothetical protein
MARSDRAALERIFARWRLGAAPEQGPAYPNPTLILAGHQDATVGHIGSWVLLGRYPAPPSPSSTAPATPSTTSRSSWSPPSCPNGWTASATTTHPDVPGGRLGGRAEEVGFEPSVGVLRCPRL